MAWVPVNVSADAKSAAELTARTSYGRLLARLTRQTGNLAAAEDALADAFAQALTSWPVTGVPDSPEHWLLTVSRRRVFDASRHNSVRSKPEVLAALASAEGTEPAADGVHDDRLRLMLVCAHPAIDEAVRPALILQVVLGLEAQQMSSAFLVSTDTLTKRLVRAKAKIKANGLRFEEPAPEDLPARLAVLLEAIYAAYFLGKEGAVADGDPSDTLRREAVYLANVVASALPEEPEALGFLALLSFLDARREAQTSAGLFVPLLEQRPATWDLALITRGNELLSHASKARRLGPFQLEAAIQAAHCYRAKSGEVPWKEITQLYATLIEHYPTIGARVGHAVALASAERAPIAGLTLLSAIPPADVRSYQPYWVARAYLCELAGDLAASREALTRAIGLTNHPRLHQFLQHRLAALGRVM
ncbi:MAG: hypothetical protein JNG84_12935 [Archangium sp.]|nr:hypothetical protein [Archangium sp.]